jgi:hypothetical protein
VHDGSNLSLSQRTVTSPTRGRAYR